MLINAVSEHLANTEHDASHNAFGQLPVHQNPFTRSWSLSTDPINNRGLSSNLIVKFISVLAQESHQFIQTIRVNVRKWKFIQSSKPSGQTEQCEDSKAHMIIHWRYHQSWALRIYRNPQLILTNLECQRPRRINCLNDSRALSPDNLTNFRSFDTGTVQDVMKNWGLTDSRHSNLNEREEIVCTHHLGLSVYFTWLPSTSTYSPK